MTTQNYRVYGKGRVAIGKGEREGQRLRKRLGRLLKNRPELGKVLRVCVDEARRTKNNFAGAWVFWRLKERGIAGPSNLRAFSGVGALLKTDLARGGKRAYYKIKDISLVDAILRSHSL